METNTKTVGITVGPGFAKFVHLDKKDTVVNKLTGKPIPDSQARYSITLSLSDAEVEQFVTDLNTQTGADVTVEDLNLKDETNMEGEPTGRRLLKLKSQYKPTQEHLREPGVAKEGEFIGMGDLVKAVVTTQGAKYDFNGRSGLIMYLLKVIRLSKSKKRSGTANMEIIDNTSQSFESMEVTGDPLNDMSGIEGLDA